MNVKMCECENVEIFGVKWLSPDPATLSIAQYRLGEDLSCMRERNHPDCIRPSPHPVSPP